MTKIIGLCGTARSGKSTAAKLLCDKQNFVTVKMAGPLKDMLRAIGFGDDHLEGDLKTASIPMLCGKTPRHAMQTLGTEWGRECIGADFWLNVWRENAWHALEYGDCGGVVCDDIRFANEADAVRAMGGKVVRLMRDGAGADGAHKSEAIEFEPDLYIYNNGTPYDLWLALRAAL